MANVLIVGGGGREHALGWKLHQSSHVDKLYFTPGNAGTAQIGQNISGPVTPKEFNSLTNFIKDKSIDLVVVGPEKPLADGLADHLRNKNIRVYGPGSTGALIESDKEFSYTLMDALGIPQARSIKPKNLAHAVRAIDHLTNDEGIVLKATGLAAGKGVVLYDSASDALNDLEHFAKTYPSYMVVQRLGGPEFQLFGFSDGDEVISVPTAFQDNKREFQGNVGRNTGGMGAHAPVPWVSQEDIERITQEIMNPVVQKLRDIDAKYVGFLYTSMMRTPDGDKVIEFNCRLGDPETQPLMMLLESDLYEVVTKSIDGELRQDDIKMSSDSAVCVVLATPTYPGPSPQTYPILGTERVEDAVVFHAGTKSMAGGIYSNGGRLLGVTAKHPEREQARQIVYSQIEKISMTNGFKYRGDIGL